MKKIFIFLLLTLFLFNCNSTQDNGKNIESNLKFRYRRFMEKGKYSLDGENQLVHELLTFNYCLHLAKKIKMDIYNLYKNKININKEFLKLSKNYKTKIKGVFAAPFTTHHGSGGHMRYDGTPMEHYLTCQVINLRKEKLLSVKIKVLIYHYKGNLVKTEFRKRIFKRSISQCDNAVVKQNFKNYKKLAKIFDSQIGKIDFIVTEAKFEKK